MRLLLPSLLITVYIFFSIIRPLKARLIITTALILGLLAISLKYIFYHAAGGNFFNPSLPVPVILAAETLYASLVCLFFLSLLKDAAAVLLHLAKRILPIHLPAVSPQKKAAALAAIALFCGSFGTWQAVRVPSVHTVAITIPTLPSELEGFSLVQLSDIHIGPVQKKAWLMEIVQKVNALSPDAVVLTGDLVDGLPQTLSSEMQPLSDLRSRCGTFAATGNHEYYYDAPGWIKIFRDLGITMLINEHRILSGGLVLGGIPDIAAHSFGLPGPDIKNTFAGSPEGLRILLSHRPSTQKIPAGVSLQLSGHTHGGLLFFLSPLISMYNSGYVNGLYRLPTGGLLYVSPGTGLWNGFSCRLGVPPEITRIVLSAKPRP